MLVREVLFGIFGGLGLFIYGIRIMGDGLHKAAGNELRRILGALTRSPLRGVLVGAGVTAIIQSSSATTVMTVGFVNAGLMTLQQAIGVVFGANIGTTITAQLIAFKLTDYALLFIGIGMILHFFVKNTTLRHFGQFMLGFGMLFLGLNIMTSVVKPFGSSDTIKNLFINFSKNPILGILTGMLITMTLQSSSVTVGLVLALASVGLLDLKGAIPLILGDNIGTCITALLASIGTSVSARRTAIAHITFNIMGTIIVILLLPVYTKLILLTAKDIARQCANAHTLFNVMNTLLFLPFTRIFARFITTIVPGEEIETDYEPKYLEKHLVYTPVLALKAAVQESIRTLNITQKMIDNSYTGFVKNDSELLDKVEIQEEAVDTLRLAITDYLMKVMQQDLSAEESRKIPGLLHVINDIERIGDLAENLRDLAKRKIEKKLPFTKDAMEELNHMYKELLDMLENTKRSLETNDIVDAEKVIEKEETMNSLRNKLKQNHIRRLEQGRCKVLSGIVFIDFVSNLEKIADHLTNIGQAVMYPLQWEHIER